MANITQETRFELSKSELIALPGQPGQMVSVQRGELWLTIDNDRRDIILAAGKSWQVADDRRMVFSALEDSCFTLTSAAMATTGRRPDGQNRWRSPPLAIYPAAMLR